MTGISTHVLDTARGRPADGIEVNLQHRQDGGEWQSVASGVTDGDGRTGDLASALEVGTYRVRFELAPYFRRLDIPSFYPYADVVFHLADASEHYHVPLLLSPYGYSTYRGS